MNFIKRDPKIYIISGKSGSGKSIVSNIIREFYGDKAIEISLSYYIKDYAKRVSDWDGSEETKPRDLLQQLGIELVKNQIDSKLFINRVLEDIKVFSYFYDAIIISDARLIDEVETIKNNYPDSKLIRVIGKENDKLTDEQKSHITETGLDNYNNYDYVINNSGTKEELKAKIIEIIEV